MKKTSLLILLLATSIIGFSQEEPLPGESKGFDKSKLFFGGNFGLSFGSSTLVNVSPQIGYRFNKYLAAGTGVNFIYSSQKTFFTSNDYYKVNQGVAGLNIFGRVYPIEQLLLQVQPEMNYTWGKVKYSDGTPDLKLDNEFVPSLLLGAGGAIPAGKGAFIVMAQYDVLQDDRSPYGNNVFFNFGYNIGF